jgi:Leucine-rich repeat (LRR) protein
VVENLEGISLKKCDNLFILSQINSKGFRNLRLVDLTEASSTIVDNFIQGRNLNIVKWLCLKKLQVLDLTQCQSLEEIPSSINQLNALQELDLNGCSNLKELPSSIGQLNALQNLDLSWCSNLQELPSSIDQLNALQHFDFVGCSKMKEYHDLLAN